LLRVFLKDVLMGAGRQPNEFEHDRVAVASEVELFVARRRSSAQDTLLVIHGGPDWDHTYLRAPVAELRGDHQLLLPDLRGCGRSTGGLAHGAYTPDLAVADLITLLDVLDVSSCSVLGFSFGGLLAQQLAVKCPDRLKRLIIASSSILTRDQDALMRLGVGTRSNAEQQIWSDPVLTGSEKVRAAAIAAADVDVCSAGARADYLKRVSEIRFTDEWAQPWQAGVLPPAGLENAITRLSATRIPTLLLHGRSDLRFPVSHALEGAERLPNARAVVIDQAAHMTHIDQPEAWLAAVQTFLNED
jgi:pimeloyl-ACP methyl ester carboxylesterase